MTTASMVGRIALLAAVRSPTPAPWTLDEPITEARSRQSGSRPAVVPGTAPPAGLQAAPAAVSPGDTLADMTAARVLRPSGNAEVAPGKPPFISARVVCVAWWGLFAVQVLRVAVT